MHIHARVDVFGTYKKNLLSSKFCIGGDLGIKAWPTDPDRSHFSTSTPLGALVRLVASDSCLFVYRHTFSWATQE